MIIHGAHMMEPEELAELGRVFDDVWAALSITAGQERAEQRTALADALLRLARLGQLDPDQIKATALRTFGADPACIPLGHNQPCHPSVTNDAVSPAVQPPWCTDALGQ